MSNRNWRTSNYQEITLDFETERHHDYPSSIPSDFQASKNTDAVESLSAPTFASNLVDKEPQFSFRHSHIPEGSPQRIQLYSDSDRQNDLQMSEKEREKLLVEVQKKYIDDYDEDWKIEQLTLDSLGSVVAVDHLRTPSQNTNSRAIHYNKDSNDYGEYSRQKEHLLQNLNTEGISSGMKQRSYQKQNSSFEYQEESGENKEREKNQIRKELYTSISAKRTQGTNRILQNERSLLKNEIDIFRQKSNQKQDKNYFQRDIELQDVDSRSSSYLKRQESDLTRQGRQFSKQEQEFQRFGSNFSKENEIIIRESQLSRSSSQIIRQGGGDVLRELRSGEQNYEKQKYRKELWIEEKEQLEKQVESLLNEVEKQKEQLKMQDLNLQELEIDRQMEAEKEQKNSQLSFLLNKIQNIDAHTEEVFASKLESERKEKEELADQNFQLTQQMRQIENNCQYLKQYVEQMEEEKENILSQMQEEMNKKIDQQQQEHSEEVKRLKEDLKISEEEIFKVEDFYKKKLEEFQGIYNDSVDKTKEITQEFERLLQESERDKNLLVNAQKQQKNSLQSCLQLQDENGTLIKENVILKKEYESFKKENAQLKEYKVQITKETQEAVYCLEQQLKEIERLRSVEEELHKLKAENSNIEKNFQQNEEQNKQISMLTEELERISIQMEEKQKENQIVKDEFTQLMEKNKKVVAEKDKLINQLQDEKDKYYSNGKRLENTIAQVNADLKASLNSEQSKLEECARLKNKIQRIEEENFLNLEEFRNQLENYYQDIIRKQEGEVILENERERQEVENIQLRKQLCDLENQLSHSRLENSRLMREAQGKNEEVDVLFLKLKDIEKQKAQFNLRIQSRMSRSPSSQN